jgi:hypothetical protein
LAAAVRDETIYQGRRLIEDIPGTAKDGARGVIDSLAPLIK